MIITASDVAMQGASTYQRKDSMTIEVTRTSTEEYLTADELEEFGLKPAATLSLGEGAKTNGIYSPKKLTSGIKNDWENDLKAQILKAFLQALQGDSNSSRHSKLIDALQRRLRVNDMDAPESGQVNHDDLMSKLNNAKAKQAQQNAPTFRVLTTSSSFKVSRELDIQNTMSFATTAQVKTGDGRTIDVNMILNMSQSFYEKVDFEAYTEGRKMIDPLVINFNAPSAMLSDKTFEFDLDCDGTSDQISQLMSGSGFLAYDKDGDGIINDGSELFGAISGNGFADLTAYDGDGNGWIDEADGIWDKLRIWSVNDDGSSSLVALGEIGIGAIYLGSVGTDYALGDLNDPNGMIRRTGFFLFEDGRAGTVQHIDLAV